MELPQKAINSKVGWDMGGVEGKCHGWAWREEVEVEGVDRIIFLLSVKPGPLTNIM